MCEMVLLICVLLGFFLLFFFSYFGGWGTQLSALGSQWFYSIIKHKGLAIDHVWAYEYEKLDPHTEWRSGKGNQYGSGSCMNKVSEFFTFEPSCPLTLQSNSGRPGAGVYVGKLGRGRRSKSPAEPVEHASEGSATHGLRHH